MTSRHFLIINFYHGKYSKAVFCCDIIDIEINGFGGMIMPKETLPINSRQQQTLLLLLKSSQPLTLKAISDELNISTRTLQREINGLDAFVRRYDLLLLKKAGVGLLLEGEEQAKQKLLHSLHASKSIQIFSPEERQTILIQHLLSMKEPTKLFYFSKHLNVTEATVSYDLDKIEPWFEKQRLTLVRKPGMGIYVEGDERYIRKAIMDLLYTHCSQEQLMDILSSHSYSLTDEMKLELPIRNRLLNFIDPKIISRIERAVQQTEQEYDYHMADSGYVGLIVHIALAIQRLNNGENISIDQAFLSRLKGTDEFAWARRLADEISALSESPIPESEVGYITTHLIGAQAKRPFRLSGQPSPIEDDVYRMVKIAEQELKVTLENDPSLIEHLTIHLESAINRIKFNIDFRNPLLDYMKKKFPDEFQAARKAAAYLETQLMQPVPEEEVGYIAMHIGAAVLRKKELNHARFRILLVCASGMGTSRLLAAQIDKELPQIQVVDTVSLFEVEKALQDLQPIDLIVSTVPFQYEGMEIAVVNPLLLPEDIAFIQSRLARSAKVNSAGAKAKEEDEEKIMNIDQYGEGLSQLLENIFIVNEVTAARKEEVIARVPDIVPTRIFAGDPGILGDEMLQREQIGGWMMQNERLAMLHCRSSVMTVMSVCVLKLMDDMVWNHASGSVMIRTVLVLLAPRQAPKEHIALISSISAALIEDEFIRALTGDDEEKLRKQIKSIVRKGYLEKINAILRGKS